MDASPAERYAAWRRRQAAADDPLDRFRELYDFPLDGFQVHACQALQTGQAVLVAAPTGSGKTVVGEFAAHLALAQGRKCFYTAPIKALSNQKYGDLVARYGPATVGLLTGDNTVNGDAPVVVMTTEVLRNMLYAGSTTLDGLGFVVLDEVHYLADRSRGAVWEEVLIHLPDHVQVVSLSATVSNAEEFGDWLGEVRGGCVVVVEERRPVPLWQHVMVGDRLYDLFVDAVDGAEQRVNPHLARLAGDERRLTKAADTHPRGRPRGRPRRSASTPSRVQVLGRLDAERLLPAIVFVFSRAGCDAAVLQCLAAGVRLTTPQERRQIRAVVEERTADLPDEDLQVLGFHDFLAGLEAGVAAHHAGMLPAFKEIVETLFAQGLVSAVFATETLALGINMPARSVVLEKLVKWNGETHADVTPAEYTQLTGRAGRRGIDIEGHAVVLWQPGLQPLAVAGLASTRTYPLRSSFRPSYNMAVNLVGQVGRGRARELLESSFAQFQADRAVVGLARQVHRNTEGLAGYREAMHCHLGDFAEYAALRQAIKDREAQLAREGTAARHAAAIASLEALSVGDVIRVPAGRFAGPALVLDTDRPGGRAEGPRPTVLTEHRQVKRLSLTDFPVPAQTLGALRIPKSFNQRVPAQRRDLAARIQTVVAGAAPAPRRRGRGADRVAAHDAELARLRAALRGHPCHGCADRDEHVRWAERYVRLSRETEQLQRRVDSRSNTIARQFDRVCAVLDELGYLRGDRVTDRGRRLAGLYAELDLVAAECLAAGVWADLDPAELAACVSALTYESRRPDDAVAPALPPGRVRERLAATVHRWGELDTLERDHHLDFLREPDLAFANAAWRWASGHRLDHVLTAANLSAGAFVRAVKQLLDLLDQIGDVAEDPSVRRSARDAVRALRRGVVAYSSLG